MELPNVPLHTEEVEEEDRHGRNEPKESGGCSGDDRGGVPADGRPLVGILQMVFNAAVLLMSCVQNSTDSCASTFQLHLLRKSLSITLPFF